MRHLSTKLNDLFGQNNNIKNSSYKKQNSNNNWKEQNEKRKKLYKQINDTALRIAKDGKTFKEYLNILSRFYKYSVGNCMLVLESVPNARQIKTKQEWIDKGYELIENPKMVEILEPNRSNDKVYYNPKEEYDISQTNAPITEEKSYDPKDILLALFSECKAEREVVDILPNGEKGSQYVKDENKLYMCRGLQPQYLIKTVIQELAKMEMQDIEQSEMKEFKTFCIAYMMCKKYGVNTEQFDFTELPKGLSNEKDSRVIKQEFEEIRKNFETINTKVNEYFTKEEKAKSNKMQER